MIESDDVPTRRPPTRSFDKSTVTSPTTQTAAPLNTQDTEHFSDRAQYQGRALTSRSNGPVERRSPVDLPRRRTVDDVRRLMRVRAQGRLGLHRLRRGHRGCRSFRRRRSHGELGDRSPGCRGGSGGGVRVGVVVEVRWAVGWGVCVCVRVGRNSSRISDYLIRW